MSVLLQFNGVSIGNKCNSNSTLRTSICTTAVTLKLSRLQTDTNKQNTNCHLPLCLALLGKTCVVQTQPVNSRGSIMCESSYAQTNFLETGVVRQTQTHTHTHRSHPRPLPARRLHALCCVNMFRLSKT